MPGPAVNHILRYQVPAAAAAWTPASLTNLVAWYSADSGVYNDAGSTLATNTQTVQQWNDKSGNAYHLKQATSGKRPQYLSGGFNSLPTVQFAAASNTGMLSDLNWNPGGSTVSSGFFVGQVLTGTHSFGRAFSASDNTGAADSATPNVVWVLRNDVTNALCGYIGGTGQTGSQAVSLATNFRFGIVYDGANGTTYLNNANATATSVSTTFSSAASGISVGQVNFGSGGLGTGGAWDGPISEVVITKSAMTSGERLSLDNYFKSHWGL